MMSGIIGLSIKTSTFFKSRTSDGGLDEAERRPSPGNAFAA
jgi:hypothetical protein